MVYLNRIYTKTGDDGTTGLGDGTRVPKTHPRIVAYGGVDELNSSLGLIVCEASDFEFAPWLRQIQNDLFDLGADLCVPEAEPDRESDAADEDEGPAPTPSRAPLRVIDSQVERLEQWIDQANARLAPLTSFVLPGGTATAARLHLSRTICRRVEIGVLHLAEFETVNPLVHWYLNRLSDLLFVLARCANHGGPGDVLWQPGQGR
jgi:cob(I)alamin adenosyltransferase